MSEKRLFGFMSVEGTLLLILGLCILILPKLTSLTFNVMVSIAFIIYGIYKFVCSIINKSYTKHFVCEMLLGVYLVVVGILLLLVPTINIYWLMALIGVYFIFESILTTAFAVSLRNIMHFWHGKIFGTMILFLIGLGILIKLPDILFSSVAVLTGAAYVLKGAMKDTLSIINRNEDFLTRNGMQEASQCSIGGRETY